MRQIPRWVVMGVLCVLGTEQLQGQHAALPRDLDPVRGPPWGHGGPWADQEPYTPHPKPPGWVDPQPSRWPWNGKRDPYDDADYSQFKELPLFGSGVQIAVLHGTLNEAVPFVAQVKFAAGVKVPAHSQSATRHVTVLSGVLNIGLGNGLDTGNTHALGPGSVTIVEPAINHFFWFSEETVIQLQGLGPLVVTYADPADDPRKKYGPSVSAPP